MRAMVERIEDLCGWSQSGGSLLENVTPEQSLEHDFGLQRRGQERRKGVGKGQRDLPFWHVEMGNSILPSRKACGGQRDHWSWAGEKGKFGRF